METQPETQNDVARRLTLSGIVSDIAKRFLRLDRGWLHTARELSTAPGPMILRYVEGHRLEFANPFAYLVAATALSYMAQALVGYRERMVAGLQVASGQSPAQAAFINQTTEQNIVPLVRELLEDGADPELTRDRTALHVAVELGHGEIVGVLLEHGADQNARDYLGRTPLFVAVAGRRPEIARTLREAGSDATVRTSRGTSILLVALRRGDRDTALWALDGGVDVNAVRADSEQATALMVAAAKGDLEMVDLLLERGAEANLTNEDGEEALELARGEKVKARLLAAMEVSRLESESP